MADQDPKTGTSGSVPNSSRFAQDLRAIREQRGVSLDEVQHDTRMPADILGRFEAGDLIGDQHYNEVYLRNLLKSYAQALGISPHDVVSAYDQAKAGTYDGALRSRYLEGTGGKSATQSQAAPPTQEAAPESSEDAAPEKPRAPGDKAPAVAALSSPRARKKEEAREPSEPARASAARPKRRVSSEKATSNPIEKSWGIILSAVVGALVVIALILWFLFRDPSPEPELAAVPAPAADTTAEVASDTAAAATPEPAPPTSAPQFQTPIELTVVAGDNPLESFRVQVDDDARRPYWIEPGQTESFTAQQNVSVWGELEAGSSGGGNYDGATLRVQGLDWTPRDGQVVRINQQNGQALLDSLARVSNAAPTG